MILSVWVKNLICIGFSQKKKKGFYPYEYMCDLEKFKEKLPNKFYISLSGTGIKELMTKSINMFSKSGKMWNENDYI